MTSQGKERRAFLRHMLTAGGGIFLSSVLSGTLNPRAFAMSDWKVGVIALVRSDGVFDVMGKRGGFFGKRNLNVEIMEMNTGATLLQGLIAGQYEAAIVSPAGSLAAISRGARLKVIGANFPGMPYLLYCNSRVKSIADLKGKRIAISQPGALAHVLVQVVLGQAGIDPRDVHLVNVGNDAERFRALVADRVDATVTHIQFLPEIEGNDQFWVALNFATEVPDYVNFCVVVRQETIDRRYDDLVQFALGVTEGVRYAIENKDETLQVMAELTKSNPQELEWVYEWFVEHKAMQPNFYVSPSAITFLQELNVSLGNQERTVPLEEAATWDIQRTVIDTLGKYPGFPG